MSLTPIPVWMKHEVIQRDGWECLSCGVTCRIWPGGKQMPDSLHIDHIIPECRRGRTDVDNLQVLCRTCNLRKGGQVIDYRLTRPVLVTNPAPPLPVRYPPEVQARLDRYDEQIAATKAETARIVAATAASARRRRSGDESLADALARFQRGTA